jgi:hypothetical protein
MLFDREIIEQSAQERLTLVPNIGKKGERSRGF